LNSLAVVKYYLTLAIVKGIQVVSAKIERVFGKAARGSFSGQDFSPPRAEPPRKQAEKNDLVIISTTTQDRLN